MSRPHALLALLDIASIGQTHDRPHPGRPDDNVIHLQLTHADAVKYGEGARQLIEQTCRLQLHVRERQRAALRVKQHPAQAGGQNQRRTAPPPTEKRHENDECRENTPVHGPHTETLHTKPPYDWTLR
jgi:hypothetical protein